MTKFILYSAVTAQSIADNLGLPEYSYYFVLKEFRPILEELGDVVLVENPADEVDAIYRQCQADGENCVFISFAPPHKSQMDLECPMLAVFAWEFDNIPYESWDGDERNDWCHVFRQHGRAISLSSHTANVVKSQMGQDFKIAAVPVPVWDLFADTPKRSAGGGHSLAIAGAVIDSRAYEITPESILPHDPLSQFDFPAWKGQELVMRYTLDDDFNSYLGGFYPAEAWGAWSKNRQPWVLVPEILSGAFTLTIDCAGYGKNAGRQIRVVVGGQEQSLQLGGSYAEAELRFDLDSPANLVQFLDLECVQTPGSTEKRTLGIGLRSITIRPTADRDNTNPTALTTVRPRVEDIEGIVYTSVFNPVDGRKNWTQIVSAFCYAFQHNEQATLILKMTQKSLTSFLGKLHHLLSLLAPFKCRVIALYGFLEDEDYQELVSMTSYYVGASGGEGLCLPMMEYMSAGIPAISTRNTAMEDYVDPDCAFIVDSSLEPSFWPHDPRKRLRTMRHRIDWYSLVEAFEESYRVASVNPDKYQVMSLNAREGLRNFASRQVVKERLRAFFREELEPSMERD